MKPIIGIIARPDLSIDNSSVMATFDEYRRAIIKFGGNPILILPPKFIDYYKQKKIPKLTNTEKNMIISVINICDGILMPGGNRIYEHDLYICKYINKVNKPVLGICMGMQTMVFYTNPSLIKVENHHIQNLHKIKLIKDTKIYKIYKKENNLVNSLHNFQVPTSGSYKPSAISSDGVIEAIEKGHIFNIGVQWHPEKMLDENKKLFEEFIKTCKYIKKIKNDIIK